jgi:O-antigen ligase
VLIGLTAHGASGGARVVPPLAVATAAAALAVPRVLPGSSIDRALSFFGGAGPDTSERTVLWSQAYDAFLAHPWSGLGTGGFSAITWAADYPHNLVLEAAAEFGVVGLALVLAFLTAAFAAPAHVWAQAKPADRLLPATVLALLTCTTVNAGFSGDITDNKALWLWAGVGVGLHARRPGP